MEHEWFVEFVDKNELDLEFVLFNAKDSELYNFIRAHGFKCTNYSLPSKYYVPFYIFLFTLKLLFKRVNFVHCHLFEASLIGIISAKIVGVKKRIHTRHHADFHHVYFPKAVKYDLLINRLSTHIIAISNNIKNILEKMEQVPPGKITLVPHGIPLKLINKQVDAKDVTEMKAKYGLSDHSPVIGVISRFIEWKGVQYIVPAFKQIVKEFPNAKLVLANANGDYEKKIMSLVNDLPVNSFVLIKFEPMNDCLFKTFDVFVHAPVDPVCEAFGQVYIEALSLEVPMVCTLSGIARDLIRDEKNAVVAEYKSADSLYAGIKKILSNGELRKKIIQQGKEDIQEYSFEKKYANLRHLYLS